MENKDQILAKALNMSPTERADIADRLLQSLDKPDEEINRQWKDEVEGRIEAFEAGNIRTVSVQDVLKKRLQHSSIRNRIHSSSFE